MLKVQSPLGDRRRGYDMACDMPFQRFRSTDFDVMSAKAVEITVLMAVEIAILMVALSHAGLYLRNEV